MNTFGPGPSTAYENDQGQVKYRGNLQSFQSTYAASLADKGIASWC